MFLKIIFGVLQNLGSLRAHLITIKVLLIKRIDISQVKRKQFKQRKQEAEMICKQIDDEELKSMLMEEFTVKSKL